jgi:3-oxoacyl-ACP reductase-like protein
VASKLKKDIAAVSPQTTLKSIVGGNSAAQNEILGDIEGEFELKLPKGPGISVG